jgi:nucleoid DNA-binding protein
MSVLFVVAPIANPQNRAAAPKFYLRTKIRGHKTHKDILAGAARNTTINAKELDLGINAWFEEVVRSLGDGFSVEVAGLGTFSLSIKSKGSDTEAEATAAKKESMHINYMANPEIRNTVNRFSLEKFKPDGTL